MNIQPPNPHCDLKKFIYFGEEPLPSHLPTNMAGVRQMQAMNNYKDDPNLSPEENQKRKEQMARLEESIRNKKEFKKSAAQKAKDKKRSKMAAQSKKKNRK